MTSRILILGAAGRLGRTAAEAFRDAGWRVTSLVRSRSTARVAPGTEIVELDAADRASLVEAASGVDVILHALNPVYTEWPRLALPFAEAAIAAARASGATLMFPGNLYNYGSPLPSVIDETTPMHPNSRKGRIRVEIEEQMRNAAAQGVRTIIVRAGDFYGGGGLGSWFDRIIVKNLLNDRVTYPGPLDVVHSWAYLPDLAIAFVRLAEKRGALGPFECFGFAGHAVTGREFVAAMTRTLARPMHISRLPWPLLRLLGPVVPIFRELVDVAYLWREPHRIDDRKLVATIGRVPSTPLDAAVAAALDELGLLRLRATKRKY